MLPQSSLFRSLLPQILFFFFPFHLMSTRGQVCQDVSTHTVLLWGTMGGTHDEIYLGILLT